MDKARTFFYVCAGVFLLALSYHLGARSAGAQAPGNQVVGVGIAATQSLYGVMVTANGDVYTPTSSQGFCQWSLCSNIFAGPTPTTRETFGALKARYRGAGAAARPEGR
jgi:hypothetical protein